MTDTMDLVQDADLRAIWGADLHAVGCAHCGLVHLVPADWEAWGATRCPACLAERLAPQPARLRPEPPELVVSFSSDLTPVTLKTNLSRWLRPVWLRPPDLQVGHLMARLIRVYLPRWLVDARVTALWQARLGFDYQVESTQERFAEGQGWKVRRLKETRVRWEPRVGRLQRDYANLTVPALEDGQERQAMARLGGYRLQEAVPYAPASLADAAVRAPSLLPDEAWPLARAALDRAVADDCQRAAGAQHSDEFELKAEYADLNWTQLLLPVYVTFYRDEGGRLVPVWINGQTGRIGGLRRASTRQAWRLTLGGAVLAAVIFGLGALLSLLKVAAPGSALMMLGFVLAFVATLPVIWAWQFNQANR